MSSSSLRGFVARNRDELSLEVIGGLVLALTVSVVMFTLDQSREDTRNARDEALSNSLFVRQAVMSERDVMPFSSLYLSDSQLSGLDLTGADFSDAVLAGAELKGSVLVSADLTEADLTGADASGADLTGALLSEASVDGLELSGALLTDVLSHGVDWSAAFYVAGDPPVGAAEILDALAVKEHADED